MNIQSIARACAILLIALAPTVALAATTVVGNSGPNGGFLGVSNGNSSFGFSYGSGSSLCNGSDICGIADKFLYIINYVLVPLLFALAFIVFLYGIAKAYIFSGGSEDAVKDGHKLVLWGLIGFVVMISLWGLVNVVANTFNLQGYSAPPTPTSIPR